MKRLKSEPSLICLNGLLIWWKAFVSRKLLKGGVVVASILFDEDDPLGANLQRSSVVAPAQRSPSAKTKAQRKRTKDDLPVHSFQTLLKDLATINKERIQPKLTGAPTFDRITIPTPVQQRTLQLLGEKL